ncbi:protein RETICULATA-RELATED 3 [Forsythia ovata]|uniref:Protein RETICULATA-RELATED 3 n=1 Tax=Forsythia ovata TaxID=205694 RepID=A0ABD1XBM4_9LAMI
MEPNFHIPCAGGGGGDGDIGFRGGRCGRDSGSGGWAGGDSDESKPSWDGFGPIGAFLNGWRSRVAADPQFLFKVLIEELVGVTACVIDNMRNGCKPNLKDRIGTLENFVGAPMINDDNYVETPTQQSQHIELCVQKYVLWELITQKDLKEENEYQVYTESKGKAKDNIDKQKIWSLE